MSWVGPRVVEKVLSDGAAARVCDALTAAGGEVYAVGGVVRDVALAADAHDVDLMVRLLSRDEVRSTLELLPGRVSEVGKSFGIIEYRGRDGCVQVSLPRKDRFIGSHHRDVDVQVDPFMSVEEDLERRDYTMNAVAVRVPTGEVHDPLGGLEDARCRSVKAVSMDVLADDPLRVMRGVVLAAKRGLGLHGRTAEMLKLNARAVENLPADRVHDEMDKLMECDAPAYGVRLAQEIGLLEVILPEVAQTYGFDQRSKYHKLNLFDHTLLVLECCAEYTDDKDVRLAALLHDVGKPGSVWTDGDGYNHYYLKRIDDPDSGWSLELGQDHEVLGASMVHELMTRLRYSSPRRTRVVELVRHHMFANFNSLKGARRFLARVGEHADDLLVLRRADDEGTDELRFFLMEELVALVRAQESAFSVRDLAIDGHDLIRLGVPAGPTRGRILRFLLEYVVDDPTLNDRETLLSFVESCRDESWDLDPGQGGATP